MCGISGFAGGQWSANQLDLMINALKHRGPDDHGTYVDERHYVGLAHTRLSIIDLSSNAKNPMHDTSGRLTIVFNGEIYNYIELKHQLSDYNFQTSSDTEVILAAYLKWGEQCTKHLIGMFAFAIWDNVNQSLFCARDRLGIKPFYYYYHNNQLIFASEIKAILSAGVDAKPNWDQWSIYLNYGYSDHSDETFFKEIYSLPAGTNLIAQNGEIKLHKYWDIANTNYVDTFRNYAEAMETLQQLIQNSISLHLRSDVPLSVNLSSGLDSGLLARIIDTQFTNQTKYTFTSSFSDPQFDEFQYVKSLGLNNFESVQHITYPETIPGLAKELTWYQEAPYGGIPSLAYFDLHKKIRQYNNPVSLEGQGVDEIFAGYEHAKIYHYADIVSNSGCDTLANQLGNSVLNHQLVNNIQAVINEDPMLISQDATTHIRGDGLTQDFKSSMRNIPSFNKPFPDHLTNLLYQDLVHTKLPRVLRMNDKSSMATGTELRVPFLDHRLVEFAFSIKSEWKIHKNQGKFMLRDLASDWIPPSWHAQNKKSVVTPQTMWLKNELSDWVNDILSSQAFRSRGIFNIDSITKTYAHFQNTEQNNSFYIWQWINTELWFQEFIDN